MKKAAIIIGVNVTGRLAPLTGAAQGARDFAAWARGAGFDVTLLTDGDGQEVCVQDIKSAITSVVEKQTYGQLVVFFAGHGLLKAPGVEMWLLSRAAEDVDEAVDVFMSSELARNSRIPHIIFVSDACRSLGHRMLHFQVRGSAIFPNREPEPPRPPVDVFYATMPGADSYEVKDAGDAITRYKGVFTEHLLRALHGKVPEVVLAFRDGEKTRWLIPPQTLGPYLEESVPRAVSHVNVRLSQYPEVRATSRPPQTFGELPEAPVNPNTGDTAAAPWSSGPGAVAPTIATPVRRPAPLRAFVAEYQRRLLSGEVDAELPADALPGRPMEEFRADVQRILAATGRGAFETETGFTVHGPLDAALIGGAGRAEVFAEDGQRHVRVFPTPQTRSALLRFESGVGAVLPVFPGFIGTVLLDGDAVIDVSYRPSENTELYRRQYAPVAAGLERRRAFAAIATRHGAFHMHKKSVDEAGGYLRFAQQVDPTLGLYAAYAHGEAGDLAQVRDLLHRMHRDGAVPFDLLLLAQERSAWHRLRAQARPFCPALTRGWSLLVTDQGSHAALRDLSTELTPSLWTVFRPSGADEVAARLTHGEFA